MKMLRWSQGDDTVIMFARSEMEAADYLRTLPLFWNKRIKPEDFREVSPPKGPSPSILLHSYTGVAVSED